jgi:hypothetical protein
MHLVLFDVHPNRQATQSKMLSGVLFALEAVSAPAPQLASAHRNKTTMRSNPSFERTCNGIGFRHVALLPILHHAVKALRRCHRSIPTLGIAIHMSPDSARLRHVSLKVARAKEHAAELAAAVQRFFASKPYSVGTKHHPETRKLIYFVAGVTGAPDDLALLAGDAIQNLSTALDHLAYQVVCKDTEDAPPNPRGTYFPIADDYDSYEASKAKKLRGAKAATLKRFDQIKPYRGGNDRLWRLARLNNIEKHRLLFTVGSQAAGIHLGQLMSGLFEDFPSGVASAMQSMNLFLNPADKGFPLQQGFELYIGQADEVPNPKQEFRFELVLNEPGVAEGKNLLDTVNALTSEVEKVVHELASLL